MCPGVLQEAAPGRKGRSTGYPPLKVMALSWGWGTRGMNFLVFLCLDIEKNQMTLRRGALAISQHSAVPSIRSGSKKSPRFFVVVWGFTSLMRSRKNNESISNRKSKNHTYDVTVKEKCGPDIYGDKIIFLFSRNTDFIIKHFIETTSVISYRPSHA